MAEGRSEHPSNDASLHQTPRSEHILPAIWTSAAPDDVLDGLSEPASRAPEPAPSRQIPLPDPFSPPLDASITRDFNFGATPGLAANPRQVVPLHEPELADPGLSPTSDPWSAGSDPGSPSKLLPQRHNDLASDDGDDYGLAEPSDASDSSTDPDPMPQQIPRRVTIQLRNVFEHYRRKFKQNPLTLRFRDRGVEAHFEAVMNEGTAFVNSLLIMLGSGQLALVLIWEYFAWGPDSVKFRAVWPYQVAMLVVCLASGILIYSVRVLRERQRLIWSIVYGIIVFVLFVVMDTAEHVSWHPTAEEPVEVFVSGNLMVLLFVYTSTLQVPTLNAAVAVLFCLGAHVGWQSWIRWTTDESDVVGTTRCSPTQSLFPNRSPAATSPRSLSILPHASSDLPEDG